MNLIPRLLWLLAGILWRPPLRLLDESILRFRVWPSDLDINLHMTNGRYLALMDLGRLDLIVRMGMLRHMIRRRWQPVAASATVRFRRSLRPFQRFQLRTRLLCWDAQWIYFEQRLERGGTLVARGIIRALLRGPDGNVPTAEILGVMGGQVESPAMPESVALWRASEDRARVEGC
jgi:acyl-CoA thioesterase FadM